jgi:hypothetical protein
MTNSIKAFGLAIGDTFFLEQANAATAIEL